MRIELTLDCADLDLMTTFWRDAAGFVVDGVIEDRYVSLRGDRFTLTLQHVDEPKTVKNRCTSTCWSATSTTRFVVSKSSARLD